MIHMAGPEFEAFIAHQDGCVVVTVRGEVDLAAGSRFEDVIAEALQASHHVVFDMADVTFLDSTGVRSLVLAVNAVEHGGSVTVRNAPEVVGRVLRISGMDKFVRLESGTDAATTSL
jgi:anti-sigma B factor antagonist